MRLHPLSFLLGIGAAAVLPLLSRVMRPVAVEAVAAGMGLVEDGRRVFAEQMELVQDLVAEAQARRHELAHAATNGHGNGGAPTAERAAPAARRRRRAGAAGADVE